MLQSKKHFKYFGKKKSLALRTSKQIGCSATIKKAKKVKYMSKIYNKNYQTFIKKEKKTKTKK